MHSIFLHRSVRKYLNKDIDEKILHKILLAGTRASTIGNMQLYSIIVTTDPKIKQELLPLHFSQAMVVEAPVVITICADTNRFSRYCEASGTKASYNNLLWFVNSATDALLAAQNMALEAEEQDLGICYLGTTIYNAKEICDVLHIPKGVIPVTTLVVGYPEVEPPLTDRLPLEAVIHRNTYEQYNATELRELWHEKESSELTAKLLEENGLESLAHVFTEKRYTKNDSEVFGQKYIDALREQGFQI